MAYETDVLIGEAGLDQKQAELVRGWDPEGCYERLLCFSYGPVLNETATRLCALASDPSTQQGISHELKRLGDLLQLILDPAKGVRLTGSVCTASMKCSAPTRI